MSLTPLDEDASEQQEPARQGVCGVLRHSTNWKCFMLTLLILACLTAITWCRLTQVTKVFLDFDTFPITMTRKLSACEDGYLYIPVAFLAMLYLLYLIECFHCPTRMQLTNTTPASHVEDMIEAMRAAQPVIWWKAMCYHYIRRCRHVTRYRNGDAYTSTQVFYERVNSHSVGTCFLFSNCGSKDISKKLVNLSKFACTKISKALSVVTTIGIYIPGSLLQGALKCTASYLESETTAGEIERSWGLIDCCLPRKRRARLPHHP
ncbi:Transmembrane protein 151B [Chionoecetes opilio]|uniref:Transmembrane protein 151B n=1 Tax=Chionoecetes opilio TaxID=41210 RepID=A0A8J4YHK1_CHIOP|nr:Transmembrane protein 151B [Chionoecetes opilio]